MSKCDYQRESNFDYKFTLQIFPERRADPVNYSSQVQFGIAFAGSCSFISAWERKICFNRLEEKTTNRVQEGSYALWSDIEWTETTIYSAKIMIWRKCQIHVFNPGSGLQQSARFSSLNVVASTSSGCFSGWWNYRNITTVSEPVKSVNICFYFCFICQRYSHIVWH